MKRASYGFLLPAGLLLHLLAGPAAAQGEDCVRGEPTPVLDSTTVAAYTFAADPGDGILAVERGLWGAPADPGVEVRLEHGGCAHFVLIYRFTFQDTHARIEDLAAVLDTAASLMRRAPVVPDWRGMTDELSRSMQIKAADVRQGGYFDGYVPVDLEFTILSVSAYREEHTGRVTVQVVQDIAL